MAVDDQALFDLLPTTALDYDNVEYHRGLLEERLMLNRCQACGFWHHPPLPRCPSCQGAELAATEVGGTGTIFLGTIMHQGQATDGVDFSTPHPVVTVELDEQPGLRYTTAAVDGGIDPIEIGRRMHLVWRRRHGLPFPAFAPDDPVVGP